MQNYKKTCNGFNVQGQQKQANVPATPRQAVLFTVKLWEVAALMFPRHSLRGGVTPGSLKEQKPYGHIRTGRIGKWKLLL